MKLTDLKAGDTIKFTDAGHAQGCIKVGLPYRVYAADDKLNMGDLYVKCADGRHFLDGHDYGNRELHGIVRALAN